MSKLSYFDCNCSIGRVPYPHLMDISDVGGLLKEMGTAGVEEALVYHTVARDSNPPLGNRLLMEAVAETDSLKPVWVVLPHHTGEIPPPAELLREMEKNGVKAVRMYPTKDFHGFSLAGWCSGELLAALAEARVPLMLDIEIVWWEAVESILSKYPALPVIVTGVSYRHNRFTYPLFERHENLFVEASRYFGAGNYEDVVERFGPRRILFGTNMPQYTGTAAVSMLTYAGIPREAKEAIAGGTLRALLMEALS
ncbi:MAG: amidohydrolase family protein [Candidatus Latescibacteria bacterium]|nr:amidohydrolase family protein [Candidatus Latescibacterota bacterium]